MPLPGWSLPHFTSACVEHCVLAGNVFSCAEAVAVALCHNVLQVVDRKKDMLLVGGENVYSEYCLLPGFVGGSAGLGAQLVRQCSHAHQAAVLCLYRMLNSCQCESRLTAGLTTALPCVTPTLPALLQPPRWRLCCFSTPACTRLPCLACPTE